MGYCSLYSIPVVTYLLNSNLEEKKKWGQTLFLQTSQICYGRKPCTKVVYQQKVEEEN